MNSAPAILQGHTFRWHMEGVAEFLAKNSYYIAIASVVSLVIGAVGLLVAFRSWKRKKLTYDSTSRRIISELKHAELAKRVIHPYYQDKIDNLTLSKIAIWNDGNDTIRSSDVVQSAPITIRSQDGIKVIDCSVIQTNEETCRPTCASIEIDDKCCHILTFDYLDRNHGFVVQVIHTGANTDDLQLDGKIMSQGNIIHASPNRMPFSNKRSTRKSRVRSRMRLVAKM